jgi:YbbR domain-containing protein
MARFYQRNAGFKLVALFLAALLWMYVTNEQNPTVRQEFKNVPLQVMKLNQNYLMADMAKTVTITIQGSKNKLSELNLKDISAWVDAADAQLGENNLPVQVALTDPSLTVVETKPALIQVTIDSRGDKQVPVQVDVSGQPGEGMLLLDPVFKPTQITVRGPREVLKNVTQALVKVDITGADHPVTNDLPVRIQDNQGNAITGDQVTVEPRYVNVMVPVIKNMPNKTVPIEAAIVGTPASGYQVTLVVVEPETVQVFGAQGVLSGVQTVKTTPVDITQANRDLTREVGLAMPAGVTRESTVPVRVVVRIIKGGERYLEGIPIQYENVPDGFEAASEVKQVSVQVEGVEEAVSKLQVSDFKAVIDVGDLRRGEHVLKIRVTGPEGIKVVGISPETATVNIWEAIR